jgi:hypothetical protein
MMTKRNVIGLVGPSPDPYRAKLSITVSAGPNDPLTTISGRPNTSIAIPLCHL